MSHSIDPDLKTSDFDYHLPPELIAQEPLGVRHASRLMVLDRPTGAIAHSSFNQIGDFLQAGDVIVANNSKVIPARLSVRRETSGGAGEILLLRKLDDGSWEALARPAKRLRDGESVTVLPSTPGKAPIASGLSIEEHLGDGLVRVLLADLVETNLETIGHTPLPPYITTHLDDPSRYQTTYASESGSAAAPTAGLHFSRELIDSLQARGVIWSEVTLHIGLDTFRPVSAERVADHQIHTEWCTVSSRTAGVIAAAKREGRRVIALGTTAARTLETAGARWRDSDPTGFSADTSIFITPGYDWTMVDAMVTNFHLPKSTLLMMISSFAGRDHVLRAYQEAIAARYRFFSFGDGMLIV